MTDKENPFQNLSNFKETIARIARVPSPVGHPVEFIYNVLDETNKITYKIISPNKLTAADIRRGLARSFSRTDVWPNEIGEVDIRV
ncbi:MAG: hypothetical protein WCD79_10715 [Chthoniobacteraceae bacterium]